MGKGEKTIEFSLDWFFTDVDEICIVRVALAMQPRVLAPNEIAPQRSLYVIHRGLVLFGGRVLSRGQSWGDDVILEDEKYFLPFLARAMTYVDVGMLTKESLYEVLQAYPRSRRSVRRATILLALRRHICMAAREFLSAASELEETGPGLNNMRSGPDRRWFSGDFLTSLADSRQYQGGKATHGNMSRRQLSQASLELDRAANQKAASTTLDANAKSLMQAVESTREEVLAIRKSMDEKMSNLKGIVDERMGALETMLLTSLQEAHRMMVDREKP